MITQVNNDLRIFYVHFLGWANRQFVCNLEEIEKVCKEAGSHEEIEVFEFWNYRLKRVRKNRLIELLEANSLNADFVKGKKGTYQY